MADRLTRADQRGHLFLPPRRAVDEKQREPVGIAAPSLDPAVEHAPQLGNGRPAPAKVDFAARDEQCRHRLKIRAHEADRRHRVVVVAARPDLAGAGAADDQHAVEQACQLSREGRLLVLGRAEEQHQDDVWCG